MTAASRVLIRPYTQGDQAAVMALAPRLTEGVASWRDPESVLEAVRGWVVDYPDRVGDEDTAVFVAEMSGRVVGFVGIAHRPHFSGEVDAYIGELVVSTETVRRGIGRALVNEIEKWARKRGYSRIALDTGAANGSARNFYAILGYAEEGVRLSKAL